MAEKTNEGRVFFYYPGTSKKKPRRIVLAGFVQGGKILVAESVLFPGKSPVPIDQQQTKTNLGSTTTVVFLDGLPPDRFNKKYGRALALDKCRGFRYNIDPTKEGVDYIKGTYKDKEGVTHELTPIPCERKLVGTIDIPEGEQLAGKLFVTKVTQYYPAKPKVIKEEPKFTIAEVANYLKAWNVVGDVIGELNAENVRKANETVATV